jgi:hypothetical protein
MGGLEGLGALARIGGEEVRIRIGQRDYPERGLATLAGDLNDGLAEVELGVAGRVRKGGRTPPWNTAWSSAPPFAPGSSSRCSRVRHAGARRSASPYGAAWAGPLCRRPRSGRWSPDGGRSRASGGSRTSDNPEARGWPRPWLEPGADPVLPSDRALRRALHEHPAPDLRPHLHVGVHPSPVHSLEPQARSLWMGSSEHGDGQVLPFSISALWVSGAPGFDQHQVEGAPSVRQRRLAVREPLFQ